MEYYEKITAIFNHYGVEAQKRKLQEECAELIRAIARGDEHNMLEEIADVEILIEQFMTIGSNFEDVEHIRIRKLERTLNRIEAEKSPCLAADCLGCTCSDNECRMKK